MDRKQQINYLKGIFYKQFKLAQEEKRIMEIREFEDSESGKREQIRNDQKVADIRAQLNMLNELIEDFISIFFNN